MSGAPDSPAEKVRGLALAVIRYAPPALALPYFALLSALWLAPFVVGGPELTGLLRSAFVLALFPSLVLLPLSAFTGWRWIAAALVVPVAAFSVAYGPSLVPRATGAVAGDSLTLLTWNLQHERGDLGPVIAVIRDADADVVAVQELSVEASRTLAASLSDVYPYQALHPTPENRAGTGLLSRYPIAAEEYWRGGSGVLSFGHIRAEIDLGDQRTTVYNVHPVPPFSLEQGLELLPHSRQLAAVMERVEAERGPLVMLGDFNMTDQFDEYRRITASYADAYRTAGGGGFGFTFPDGDRLPLPPLVRLDYVFCSRDWRAIDSGVIASSGTSDHRPVWARLTFVADGS